MASIDFSKESEIPGFPLEDSRDRRFMSMPAYLGGRFHLAGEKILWLKWAKCEERTAAFHFDGDTK